MYNANEYARVALQSDPMKSSNLVHLSCFVLINYLIRQTTGRVPSLGVLILLANRGK